MNIEVPIEAVGDDIKWSAAIASVNAWRGACMQCFAQAEGAATETLLVLHRVEDRGKEVRLRHLVGQRLSDLAAAIEPNGPFGADGKAAYRALEEFREHEGLRTLLGHGVAKVTLERSGEWIVIMRHLSIKAHAEGRDIRVFEQSEADAGLSELRKRSNKVCSTLGSFRRLFPVQERGQNGRLFGLD